MRGVLLLLAGVIFLSGCGGYEETLCLIEVNDVCYEVEATVEIPGVIYIEGNRLVED